MLAALRNYRSGSWHGTAPTRARPERALSRGTGLHPEPGAPAAHACAVGWKRARRRPRACGAGGAAATTPTRLPRWGPRSSGAPATGNLAIPCSKQGIGRPQTADGRPQTVDRRRKARCHVSQGDSLAVLLSSWPIVFACVVATLAAPPQGRRVDDGALKNAGESGDDWLTYGLTQAETRYSPLNQINAGNVSRLGLAWSYDLGAGGGNQEATPLVWNGTLYGITNWSVVFALDVRTGKEKWRWDPEVNQAAVRPKICCGVVNRGDRHLSRPDHRAGHRRQASGARRGNRQGGVGSAGRISAGPTDDHDGAAHRQGQGDHRRQRRRQADARLLRRLRRPDGTARVAFLYGPRRSVEAVRKCRDEEGRRHLGRHLVEERRRRRRLGRHGLRPGSGARLCRHGERRAMAAAAPHHHRQGQSLCLLDPGGRCRHR